jgi:hypothetical protein
MFGREFRQLLFYRERTEDSAFFEATNREMS